LEKDWLNTYDYGRIFRKTCKAKDLLKFAQRVDRQPAFQQGPILPITIDNYTEI
jgi:hypothetical protein